MVSTVGAPSTWPVFPLGSLVAQVDAARDEGKYLFIWDKQGNVATFFQYKGKLHEFHREVVKAAINKTGTEEGLEQARKALIAVMRDGDKLLYDFGTCMCDLKGEWTKPDVFPADVIFNREEWIKDEVYKPFVKEEENHMPGGMNKGHYCANLDFSITLRHAAEEEETITEFLGKIPHIEKFKCIIIQ